jgi:hypothetical protein
MVVLTISSPTGHSYRLRRAPETEVIIEGPLAILHAEKSEHWKENFSRYDARW